MKRVYCLSEGQTEETFVKRIIQPHLLSFNVIIQPILFSTKGSNLKKNKGGVNDYNKLVKEIKKICEEHHNEYVTSFVDYYGLNNLPNIGIFEDKYEMIFYLECQICKDVNHSNYIPYLSLHEFESLLFSKPDEFSFLDKRAATKFEDTLKEFNNNPELINNNYETAPSRRIVKEIKTYSKVSHGYKIANKITLKVIREKCKHFSSWIDKLENI